MTVGPDLDWLADPEANIRPEVAHILETQPDAIIEPAAEPAQEEEPAQRDVRRQNERPLRPTADREPVQQRPRVEHVGRRTPPQTEAYEIRIPVPAVAVARVPVGMAVLCAGLVSALALYAGARFGARVAGPRTSTEVATVASSYGAAALATPVEATPNGTISGLDVNLRSGPGLGYSVVAKLQDGESVSVRDERAGWTSISTSTGGTGWVFGAYVGGTASATQSPAIVRHLLVGGIGPSRVVLRPGERVLHRRAPNGQSIALLPDGRQVAVEEGGLADVR